MRQANVMEQKAELDRRYPSLPEDMRKSLDVELADFRRVKNYKPPPIISELFKAWTNFRSVHEAPLTYADIVSIKGVFNLQLSPDEVVCMFLLDRTFYGASNDGGK